MFGRQGLESVTYTAMRRGSRKCCSSLQPGGMNGSWVLLFALILYNATGNTYDLRHMAGLLNQSIELCLPIPFDKVDWFYAATNETLPEKREYDERILVQDGTLLIHGLKKEDSGIYTARITHTDYVIDRKSFILTVYDPVPHPAIRIGWEKRSSDWCNVTLRCSVPLNTSSLSYTWRNRHNNSEYQLYDNGDTTQVSLTPESWDMELQCVVHNPADQKNTSVRVCAASDKAENQNLYYLLLLLLSIIVLIVLIILIWMLWTKSGKVSHKDCCLITASHKDYLITESDMDYKAIPSLNGAHGVGMVDESVVSMNFEEDPLIRNVAPPCEEVESSVQGGYGTSTVVSVTVPPLVSAPDVGEVDASKVPVYIEVAPVVIAPLHEVAESIVPVASGTISGAVPSLASAPGVGEAGACEVPMPVELAPPAAGEAPLREVSESVVLDASGAGSVPSLASAPGVGEAGASEVPMPVELAPPAGGDAPLHEEAESVVLDASGAIYTKKSETTESTRQNDDDENLKYPIQETEPCYSTVNKNPAVKEKLLVPEFIDIHSSPMKEDHPQKCENEDLAEETDCLLMIPQMPVEKMSVEEQGPLCAPSTL